MGSREIIGAVVSAWLVGGCGPTTGPLGESMDTGTTTEPASSDGDGDEDRGTTGAVDEGEGSTDDAAGSSTGPLMGDVEMYGPCSAGDCAPGLSCTVVSFDPPATICTAECFEPARDCDAPPDGWSATCGAFTHMPPDPFCAIECDADTACPEGMSCALESPQFSPPFYCVPAG